MVTKGEIGREIIPELSGLSFIVLLRPSYSSSSCLPFPPPDNRKLPRRASVRTRARDI